METSMMNRLLEMEQQNCFVGNEELLQTIKIYLYTPKEIPVPAGRNCKKKTALMTRKLIVDNIRMLNLILLKEKECLEEFDKQHKIKER